ncbi:MAG: hypothetical protein HZA63_04295 [Rhodocyclales bacterium]|nr:hypothetical protein [Rhodocyclales bacterium]
MKTCKLISFLAAGMLFAAPAFASDTYECVKASCDFEASGETTRPTQAATPDFHEQLARWIEALHANCNHPGQQFDRELARRLEALGANCDHPGPEFMAQLVALLQSGQ